MRSHKLLIAEDQANTRLSLEFLMKREGFNVEVASDGQEALDAIAKNRPDLVLLDVLMPGKTGLEVCQELRSNADWRGIPVLFLSAQARQADVAKGLAMGGDAYMTKPFASQELVKKVHELLERTR